MERGIAVGGYAWILLTRKVVPEEHVESGIRSMGHGMIRGETIADVAFEQDRVGASRMTHERAPTKPSTRATDGVITDGEVVPIDATKTCRVDQRCAELVQNVVFDFDERRILGLDTV